MNIKLSSENLSIGYDNVGSSLCSNINFELMPQDFVMLMGKNGIGKTTLLNTLAGLQKPLCGDVIINDKSIHSYNVKDRSRLISFVFSSVSSANELMVSEILRFSRYPHLNWYDRIGPKDTSLIRDISYFLNISDLLNRKIGSLSDGQKKRVFIARSLVQDTPIIFLDEPTAHLDLPSKIEIIASLKSIATKFNKIIIVADHFWDLSLMHVSQMWLMTNQTISIGAPEDFLLSGEIENIFSFDSHHISLESGQFQMLSKPQYNSILVEGDRSVVKWVKNFLLKGDYLFDRNEKIMIENDKFVLYIGEREIYSCDKLFDLSRFLKARSK